MADKRIRTRLSEEQHAIISDNARRAGMTIEAFVKKSAMDNTGRFVYFQQFDQLITSFNTTRKIVMELCKKIEEKDDWYPKDLKLIKIRIYTISKSISKIEKDFVCYLSDNRRKYDS